MNGFGVRVREYRKRAGLTQEDAARAAGITLGQFQKIEYGSNLYIDTAMKISAALGVDLNTLVDGVEFPQRPKRRARVMAEPEAAAEDSPFCKEEELLVAAGL